MKNRIKFILCAVMACLVFAGCKNENIEASDTGVDKINKIITKKYRNSQPTLV